MKLSAKEAAEAVGMTRQGIIKSIKTGKISASKNENGEWQIEPSELFRVYNSVHTNTVSENKPVQIGIQEKTLLFTGEALQKIIDLERQNAILSEKLQMTEEILIDARKDKEYLQNQLKSSMNLLQDMRERKGEEGIFKKFKQLFT
jgi:hypothetical protein